MLVQETGKWWRKDFYTEAGARDFIIEPRLGGKAFEDWGNGKGVVWATVTAIRSPHLLELAGVSSPAWGGPSTHDHSFRREEREGSTILRFTDAVHGRVGDKSAASLQESWQLLSGETLREYCESDAA